MKSTTNKFTSASALVISAAALVATLLFTPLAVAAADKADHEQEHTELRIKDMHTKFNITAAQEEQWAKIAQVMLDDAKNMDVLTQARIDHAEAMTAIDDLKSYGEIAEAHAEGIRKLTPLFTDLYASMSDEQKKAADTLFSHFDHKHGHKKWKVK